MRTPQVTSQQTKKEIAVRTALECLIAVLPVLFFMTLLEEEFGFGSIPNPLYILFVLLGKVPAAPYVPLFRLDAVGFFFLLAYLLPMYFVGLAFYFFRKKRGKLLASSFFGFILGSTCSILLLESTGKFFDYGRIVLLALPFVQLASLVPYFIVKWICYTFSIRTLLILFVILFLIVTSAYEMQRQNTPHIQEENLRLTLSGIANLSNQEEFCNSFDEEVYKYGIRTSTHKDYCLGQLVFIRLKRGCSEKDEYLRICEKLQYGKQHCLAIARGEAKVEITNRFKNDRCPAVIE